MVYNKFNHKNNAICLLSLDIEDDASVLIGQGNYNRFPTANFVITVTETDSDGAVTARENMLISTRSGATFNVATRAYEPVPIDDDATSSIQQPLPFRGGVAVIENVMSTAVIEDEQNEITRLETDKFNKSGGAVTGAVLLAKWANKASASTVDLSTATGNEIHITGTTTITSFGTVQAGAEFTLIFDGILTLTHNATSLILPNNGSNITTGAWDSCIITSEGSGNWKITQYQKANWLPLQTSIDITGAAEKTTFDLDDETIIYDIDWTANKKQKFRTIFGQSFEAGENIAVDDAVYISTSDNKAYRTDATSTTKIQVVGFALNTVTTGQTVYVWFSPKIESGNIYAQSTNTQSTTYNSVDSGTNSFGYKITTTKACSIVSITKSASCTATRALVKDSAGTVIDTATFSGNTATFSSPVALSNATVYRIECDKSGASYSWHTKSWSTFNSSTDFNYTAWSNNGGDSNGPSGQTMNSYGFNIASVVTTVTSLVKTPWTTYFLTDTPGKINSVAGTYKCKVGIALTSAILAFQPQIKDIYIT